MKIETYVFYWSPEGREIYRVVADSYKRARAAFRKACPQHAKYMGEVYSVIDMGKVVA